MYLFHRFIALSDLIFDSYAGLYGYNDRVLITESKFKHNEGVDTDIGFFISDVTDRDTYLL